MKMHAALPLLASFLVLAPLAQAGTWYVRRDAGPGGDGTSWASALQRVQDAQGWAQSGDQIWVAKGVYRPGAPGSPRSATFVLTNGVALYGGFAGTESALAERDIAANPTILSGDLLLDDRPAFVNRADNCYHVVSVVGTGPGAVLDGFTVAGGNADRGGANGSGGGMNVTSTSFGGPSLANLRFVENSANGSGGAVSADGSLAFTDCVFDRNRALGGGGAIYTEQPIVLTRCVLRANQAGSNGGAGEFFISSTADLNNCLISGNTAASVGGIYGFYTETRLRNCVLTGNHATNIGGAAVDGLAILRLYNSIAWGNTDTTHASLYDQNLDSNSAVTSFTAVQGGFAPWNQDPLWVDPLGPDGISGSADDDLRLSCLSPYIDGGSNAVAPPGAPVDLAGNARFQDDPATADTGSGTAPIIDLGPYEFVCGCDAATNYCTALANTSGGPASISWSGSTSVFANNFTLLVSGGPPLKNGLFYYGAAQTSVPWGDGIRCVGGALQRLPIVQLDALGAASWPLDFTVPPAGAGPNAITPGSTWNFQYYFRDPLGGPAGWNYSDGLSVGFCP